MVRAEPRLRIGAVEALTLAPLVNEWLERGYGERDLAAALLGGLPTQLHSAVALLRDRLTRKLPPAPRPPKPACAPGPGPLRLAGRPRWTECADCGRPVRERGRCASCAAVTEEERAARARATDIVTRGRALVRAALEQGAVSLKG
ncbi:hypothetical protein [Streptomyces sp. NPDC007088]|uniref:hypothetical protein n=1 Tax=Streptomyces sp. NPDC007088 TaxID=3364773 RepID=UPI0036B68B46